MQGYIRRLSFLDGAVSVMKLLYTNGAYRNPHKIHCHMLHFFVLSVENRLCEKHIYWWRLYSCHIHVSLRWKSNLISTSLWKCIILWEWLHRYHHITFLSVYLKIFTEDLIILLDESRILNIFLYSIADDNGTLYFLYYTIQVLKNLKSHLHVYNTLEIFVHTLFIIMHAIIYSLLYLELMKINKSGQKP